MSLYSLALSPSVSRFLSLFLEFPLPGLFWFGVVLRLGQSLSTSTSLCFCLSAGVQRSCLRLPHKPPTTGVSRCPDQPPALPPPGSLFLLRSLLLRSLRSNSPLVAHCFTLLLQKPIPALLLRSFLEAPFFFFHSRIEPFHTSKSSSNQQISRLSALFFSFLKIKNTKGLTSTISHTSLSSISPSLFSSGHSSTGRCEETTC